MDKKGEARTESLDLFGEVLKLTPPWPSENRKKFPSAALRIELNQKHNVRHSITHVLVHCVTPPRVRAYRGIDNFDISQVRSHTPIAR